MASPSCHPLSICWGDKFLSCFAGNDYFWSLRKGGYILGEVFALGNDFSLANFVYFLFCGLLLKIISATKLFLP